MPKLAGIDPMPVVDILMSAYNGTPFIEGQIRSLQAQSHTNWHLWVRDDGSSDDTVETLQRLAEMDPRIHLLPMDGRRLGALGGFAYLLQNAPEAASYLMFCDGDDVWLPQKIEVTLEAMLVAEKAAEGEGRAGRPLLVHTDLAVVGRELEPIAESFWQYENIRAQPVKLNRLLVHNSVTGCTVMINASLRRLAEPVPAGVVMHDWWLALVAACFGRIVSIPRGTILYRQHGRNDTGAKPYGSSLNRIPSRLMELSRRSALVQASIRRTAIQASALLARFDDTLRPDDRELLSEFSRIPDRGPIARKCRLLRLGTLGNGWQRQARYLLLG